jgi:hypothetical protein
VYPKNCDIFGNERWRRLQKVFQSDSNHQGFTLHSANPGRLAFLFLELTVMAPVYFRGGSLQILPKQGARGV